jgi:pimeloyl-ACP methyl ester carboxylesterase
VARTAGERTLLVVRLRPEQYTPDDVIADLTALLDHLGADQVDVLGFSYGGLIAQRLALTTARVRRPIVASRSIPPVPPDAYAGSSGRAERDRSEAIATGNVEISHKVKRS